MSPLVLHITRRTNPDDLSEPALPEHPGRLTHIELRERLQRHFADSDDGEMRLKNILWNRVITRGDTPQGLARGIKALGDTQRVVSLSDIPPPLANRIARSRSTHGIGFRKDWVTAQGGQPTWSLPRHAPAWVYYTDQIAAAKRRGIDPSDPLWTVTPHIDEPRFMPGGGLVSWEHERE